MSIIKKRILAYLAMGISLVISIKLVKDIYKLWHVDERIIEAETELRAAKQEQEVLREKIKKTSSSEWWEEQVRNTLKMAKPNEEVVIVPEEITKKRREISSSIENEGEENFSNWQKWRRLFVY